MRGNNTLHLNDATVVEALQEYLDKRVTGPGVKVCTVDKTSIGSEVFFVVKTSEKKEDLPRDPIQPKL